MAEEIGSPVCLFIYLSVCVFVRSITQKRMIQHSSNLVYGMILGYPTSDMVLGLKGQGYRVRVRLIGSGLTALRRGFVASGHGRNAS